MSAEIPYCDEHDPKSLYRRVSISLRNGIAPDGVENTETHADHRRLTRAGFPAEFLIHGLSYKASISFFLCSTSNIARLDMRMTEKVQAEGHARQGTDPGFAHALRAAFAIVSNQNRQIP